MSINVSGFSAKVRITASSTFPTGFTITEFPGDADPLDVTEQDIADAEMGVNGDLVVWSKPTVITVKLSVIPNSESDVNLNILLQANRVARNKTSAQDKVNMTVIFPNGDQATYENGFIAKGMVNNSIASAGRLKTKAYTFMFENFTGNF